MADSRKKTKKEGHHLSPEQFAAIVLDAMLSVQPVVHSPSTFLHRATPTNSVFCSAAAAVSTVDFQGALQSSASYRKGARTHQVYVTWDPTKDGVSMPCGATLHYPQINRRSSTARCVIIICASPHGCAFHPFQAPIWSPTSRTAVGVPPVRCMLARAPHFRRSVSHTNFRLCEKHLVLSPTHNPTR